MKGIIMKVTTFEAYTVDYATGKGVMTSLGVGESTALIALAGIGLTTVVCAVSGGIAYVARKVKERIQNKK